MPRFEAPVPYAATRTELPPGWVEPPMLSVPPRSPASPQPLNGWTKAGLAVVALALLGLVVGLVALPFSFSTGAEDAPDTWLPLAVVAYTAAWVVGFGIVAVVLGAVGAWRSWQASPERKVADRAMLGLLVSAMPIVLIVTFLVALNQG